MSTETLAPPKTKSQALRSYHVADYPAVTGREEEWRFTPVPRLRDLAKATEVEDGAASWSVAANNAVPGVRVDYITREDARLGSVLTPFDRISALAYGAFDRAALIELDKGAILAEPAVVTFSATGTQTGYGHTYVEIGELAEGTLVLQYTGSATIADNVEVSVGDGANLTFVTVTDWAIDAVQAQHMKFRIGRDARLTHIQVTLGGNLVRQYTSVDYADRGGDAELWGIYFAGAGEHFEHRLLVDHAVPDCRSYVGYRGALQGQDAHTVWVGDVLIRAEATGTETYEINRNLVLSDGARADSIPNLEIETGEVRGAGHASATGRFDDEQLFYLMARGIPEDEARKLVVRGFFGELIAKIPLESLRERLTATIEERLAVVGA